MYWPVLRRHLQLMTHLRVSRSAYVSLAGFSTSVHVSATHSDRGSLVCSSEKPNSTEEQRTEAPQLRSARKPEGIDATPRSGTQTSCLA